MSYGNAGLLFKEDVLQFSDLITKSSNYKIYMEFLFSSTFNYAQLIRGNPIYFGAVNYKEVKMITKEVVGGLHERFLLLLSLY